MSQVNIKVKLQGDDSEIAKTFEKIGQKAKKGVVYGSKTPERTPPQSARRVIDKESLRERTRSSVYENKSRGEGVASGAQGAISEGKQGAFYSTFSNNLDAMKTFMQKHKEAKNNENATGREGASNNLFANTRTPESASKAIETATINITNANFKDIKNLPKGNNNQKETTSIPGSPSLGGDDLKGRGSVASKVYESLPFVGGIMAAGTTVLLKLVSDIGQKYTQAMMSQSSTLGATNGYYGRAQGMFANADLAQAVVQRGRITGKTVKEDGNISDQEMKFAYTQGVGIGDVTASMAKLKKGDPKASLNWYRGAATESGFSGLKQSEFLSKMAEISEGVRAKGYSGDMGNFARLTAGIGYADGSKMDPSARMGMAESLAEKGRAGLFGGGILGSLGLVKAMEKSGGDVMKASQMLEENPQMMGEVYNSLRETSPEAAWFIGKKELPGMSTKALSNFQYSEKNIKAEGDIKGNLGNTAMMLDNKEKMLFSGEGGRKSAEIGYNLSTQMMDMFKQNEKTIVKLATVIEKTETGMLNGVKLLPDIAKNIASIAELFNPNKAQGDGLTKILQWAISKAKK